MRKYGMQIADRGLIRFGANHFGPYPVPPALSALHRRFHLKVLSCLWWHTPPDWKVPERRIGDTLLYIPVRGVAELALRNRWQRCGPGSIAVLPEGLPQTARYARGCHCWDVIAVHIVLDDAWRNHFATGFNDHVLPLRQPEQWSAQLARLAALLATDRHLGESFGHDLIRLLLSSLLLDGVTANPFAQGGDPRIAAAIHAIEDDPGHANVNQLARAAELSPARFRQLFLHSTGQAPKAFVAERQWRKACELLRDGNASVRDVAAECGFCNDHHFHRRFKARFGTTPSQWRRLSPSGP